MFDSTTDLARKLAETGYFIDPVMAQVVFLAARLKKPLLLEGPAGSGKTQLALSVAAAAGIRSINRAIARVQSSAWSASGRTHGHSAPTPAPAVSMNAPKFVKIVAVPRSTAG